MWARSRVSGSCQAAPLGLSQYERYAIMKRYHTTTAIIPGSAACVVPHADVQSRTLRVRKSSSRRKDHDFSTRYGL
ncbi:MAG TPA: hypothetical protein VN203_09805 [Candidatus Acidoferrum sp.]|nr:hypothetical protein [Candidatus Acidoferrum sp.]